MNISKKYFPYLLVLGIGLTLVLVGMTSAGGTGDLNVVQAGALPDVSNAPAQAETNAQAVPASRETTPAMQSPSDATTVVLSGEMGNGGLWSWEDIGNLLGVYSAYGAYVQVTVDGQVLNGVPFSYLLHYARVNDYATTFILTNRSEERFTYSAASLIGCGDCAIALDANNTLSLILPGFEPGLVRNLMRIEAYAGAPAVLSVQDLPTDPQTISLMGYFARGGEWTWEQISNLLGVYGTYGAYVQVVIEDQPYAGVPLNYLIEYAGLSNSASALVIYDRAGDRTSASAAALQASCANCVIAQTADNTLALLMPGHDPAIIGSLAAIEAR